MALCLSPSCVCVRLQQHRFGHAWVAPTVLFIITRFFRFWLGLGLGFWCFFFLYFSLLFFCLVLKYPYLKRQQQQSNRITAPKPSLKIYPLNHRSCSSALSGRGAGALTPVSHPPPPRLLTSSHPMECVCRNKGHKTGGHLEVPLWVWGHFVLGSPTEWWLCGAWIYSNACHLKLS